MSRRRRKTAELNSLAADLGGEDGGDPKDFHAKPWDTPKQAGRKGRQLCRQVKEALHLTLAACADEVLQDAIVATVDPAPHTNRLRVHVAAEDRSATAAALARAVGYLRGEVARAINRRHVPELVFEVL